MKPDTARLLASFVVVACMATITILGATDYNQPEGYIAAAFLTVFAVFVAVTQDP